MRSAYVLLAQIDIELKLGGLVYNRFLNDKVSAVDNIIQLIERHLKSANFGLRENTSIQYSNGIVCDIDVTRSSDDNFLKLDNKTQQAQQNQLRDIIDRAVKSVTDITNEVEKITKRIGYRGYSITLKMSAQNSALRPNDYDQKIIASTLH